MERVTIRYRPESVGEVIQRVCLLDPVKKAAYDAKLRDKTAPVIVIVPPPAPEPLSVEIQTQPVRSIRPSQRKPWWQDKPTQFSLLGAAACAIVLLTFFVGQELKQPESGTGREQQPVGVKPPSAAKPLGVEPKIEAANDVAQQPSPPEKKTPDPATSSPPKPEKNDGGPRQPHSKERIAENPAAEPAKPVAKMEAKPVQSDKPALGPTGLPLIDGKFPPPSESRLMKPNVIARLDPLQIRINGQPLAETSYKDRVVVRWRIDVFGNNSEVPLERFAAHEISAKDLRGKLKMVRIQAMFAIRPRRLDGDDRPIAETDWLELLVKKDCQYDIYFDLGPKGVQLLQKEAKVDAE